MDEEGAAVIRDALDLYQEVHIARSFHLKAAPRSAKVAHDIWIALLGGRTTWHPITRTPVTVTQGDKP